MDNWGNMATPPTKRAARLATEQLDIRKEGGKEQTERERERERGNCAVIFAAKTCLAWKQRTNARFKRKTYRHTPYTFTHLYLNNIYIFINYFTIKNTTH